ncbi:MAG: hypothetical protein ABJG15_05245 [Hyphomonadaceae bacterium]
MRENIGRCHSSSRTRNPDLRHQIAMPKAAGARTRAVLGRFGYDNVPNRILLTGEALGSLSVH